MKYTNLKYTKLIRAKLLWGNILSLAQKGVKNPIKSASYAYGGRDAYQRTN